MNQRTGTPSEFSATARKPASRNASPLNWVGRGAIAAIALTCGWTIYSNVSGTGISGDAAVGSVRLKSAALPRADQASSFAERFGQASFSDRFGAFVAAVPEAPKKKNVYVALLDPTYSLGPQPAPFAPAPPASFGRRLADQPGLGDAAPTEVAEALPLPPVKQQMAMSVPLPSARPSDIRLPQNRSPSEREAAQAVKTAVLAAVAPKPTLMERLFGKMPSAGAMMAYASPDGGVSSDGQSTRPGGPPYDRSTAVYDISAAMVYLPDGTRLEAHSGLGSRLDDPRYVNERMRGATPPHTYDLTLRESLFHGVQALRLNPVGGEGAIHGRNGLLAHTYMLGPNGDSNGCVSFKDYNRFLQAYRNGTVKRLVVVAKLD
jgi:hypothetical protein